MYNHESERRGPEFVTRKITLNAAKIKLGLAKKLELGNLDSKQDWGYAPDYVEAIWSILQQKKPDDFIVATGMLHSVRDICQIAFSHFDLDYQNFVTINQKFYRDAPKKVFTGNPSKAKAKLNWQPKLTFKDMIIKMTENDYKLEKQNA